MKAMLGIRSRFRDLPIKGKVMLVTCTASLVALFAVAGGLYVFQLRNFRANYQRELQTLAQIMADNCATALAFHDAKTAGEVLAPLHVKPEVENAACSERMGKGSPLSVVKANARRPSRAIPRGSWIAARRGWSCSR